jgi:hypothetical protein
MSEKAFDKILNKMIGVKAPSKVRKTKAPKKTS